MHIPCTDGIGQPQKHDAEGWLCAPDGKPIVAMCREHAALVIREFADVLGETWTFEEQWECDCETCKSGGRAHA